MHRWWCASALQLHAPLRSPVVRGTPTHRHAAVACCTFFYLSLRVVPLPRLELALGVEASDRAVAQAALLGVRQHARLLVLRREGGGRESRF